MKMKLLLTSLTLAFTLLTQLVNADSGYGAIKGRVVDAKTGEPLAYARVFGKKNGVIIQSTQSDQDGVYTFQMLKPGSIEIEAVIGDYKAITIKGVMILPDKFTFLNIRMNQLDPATDSTSTGMIKEERNFRRPCPIQSVKIIQSGLPANYEGYADFKKDPENFQWLSPRRY